MSRLVLVTGGAGFIGSHLVDALLARGDRVRVLDDFSTGRRENLAHCLDDVELLEGDVRDLGLVARAVAGCDGVLHEAAVASVALSLTDPVGAGSVTHGGTVNVTTQARRAGVGALVLASSCAVYGDAERLPVSEDAPPRPRSPYALAKLLSEGVCRAAPTGPSEGLQRLGGEGGSMGPQAAAGPSEALWGAQRRSSVGGGMRTVCLRYFNVYGPRQDPSSEYAGVIARFMEVAVRRGAAARRAGDAAGAPRYVVYGDGRQTRDFVYVSDVVAASLLALDACLGHSGRGSAPGAAHPSGVDGLVLNVGTGVQVSVLELVAAVERAAAEHAAAERFGGRCAEAWDDGHRVEVADDLARLVEFRPPREGDIRASQADVARACAALGYQPAVSYAEGLAATYEWYARERDARRAGA